MTFDTDSEVNVLSDLTFLQVIVTATFNIDLTSTLVHVPRQLPFVTRYITGIDVHLILFHFLFLVYDIHSTLYVKGKDLPL